MLTDKTPRHQLTPPPPPLIAPHKYSSLGKTIYRILYNIMLLNRHALPTVLHSWPLCSITALVPDKYQHNKSKSLHNTRDIKYNIDMNSLQLM